jgi:glycosyltransferase involved in cell wall biosynthesis
MPSFAVVVVARNEAECLPRLVASLEAFTRAGGTVDVVDTGSDDGTARVARELGCRVREVGDRFTTRLSDADAARIEERFAAHGDGPLVAAGQRLFDFAAARQAAGELADRDFVWQLDGGDEVVALDRERVDQRIGRGDAGVLSYRLQLGATSFTAARFYDRLWYRWRGRSH